MVTDQAISPPVPFLLPITGRRNGRQGVVIGHARVCDDDFTRSHLARFRWHDNGIGYAYRTSRKAEGPKRRTILLHVVVFEHYHGPVPDGLEIDHEDRDPMNNQPGNLRAVTRAVNMANTGRRRTNKSGYRGVHWCKTAGKWVAKARLHGRRVFLGHFDTALNAAAEVNKAYQKHHPNVQVPNPLA